MLHEFEQFKLLKQTCSILLKDKLRLIIEKVDKNSVDYLMAETNSQLINKNELIKLVQDPVLKFLK